MVLRLILFTALSLRATLAPMNSRGHTLYILVLLFLQLITVLPRGSMDLISGSPTAVELTESEREFEEIGSWDADVRQNLTILCMDDFSIILVYSYQARILAPTGASIHLRGPPTV